MAKFRMTNRVQSSRIGAANTSGTWWSAAGGPFFVTPCRGLMTSRKSWT